MLFSTITLHKKSSIALVAEKKSICGDQMETIAQRSYNQNVDKVFKTLLNILNENYDVKSIDDEIRCVEVSSGMSLFSFGENFEIVVAEQNRGSIVRVKAKSRIRWNITSDIEEKSKQILELLEENLS